MLGHGWRWLVVAVGLACIGGVTRADEGPGYLRPMQEDAELTDLCFVDAEHGWAVGDRGVIWHTADGGRRWQLQPSGVTCRLESVCFLDAQRGWAAGGETQAGTLATRGVLLRTRDGGATWQQDTGSLLPALRQIRFFDADHGLAIGESSALFPTGLCFTDTGGRSWAVASGSLVQGWLHGDFVDPYTGVLAGRRGGLATVRRRAVDAPQTPELGLRALRRVQLVAPTSGWLVGDGGLVLQTGDLGRNWLQPAADPTTVTGEAFDWHAVAVRGPQVWIAGSPGTRILHSPDAGRSWQSHPTGQSAALHAIRFVDDTHGWAVGALGTILHTADGGRTWQRQHAGATRAALLTLLAEPQQAPLELIARLAAQEGYITATEFLVRRDLETGSPAADSLAARARAALAIVGASTADTAWDFPLRQTGLALSGEQIVEMWNDTHDGHGVARLEAHLVRQIRQWRPEIVVTHAASPRGNDPLGHVVNQLVVRAVEAAADATRFPDQTTQQGLEPWRVKKVVGLLPAGQLGTLNVTTSQLAPRLGCSLSDLGDQARALLSAQHAPAPTAIGFQVCVDTLPQGVGTQDFLSGITLYPGGEARRHLYEGAEGADQLRRAAQKHRNVQAILARRDRLPIDRAGLAAQAGELTMGLDESGAGDVLYQMAQHYWREGRWELAAEMSQALVTRYPKHRLAGSTLVWMLRYWSSAEVGWTLDRRAQQLAAQPELPGVGFNLPARAMQAAAQVPGANNRGQRIDTYINDAPGTEARAERATAVAKQIEQLFPSVFNEPIVQFPLGVAQRNQGYERQATRFLLNFTRTRAHDAWWACAAAEQWQADPKGPAPKSLAHVAIAGARPRLDGKFDDPIWATARAVSLSSPLGDDDDWPTTVQLAYDQEFLYLALRCRTLQPVAAPPSTPRPRDPDLAANDRVELYLDLDRDYATWFKFTVDARGWVAEECWGDTTWNPTWFVAAATEDNAWTAEVAIPLAVLTRKRPESREVWAVGLQRIAPGLGFQSWTTPAAIETVPEGFGYAVFE